MTDKTNVSFVFKQRQALYFISWNRQKHNWHKHTKCTFVKVNFMVAFLDRTDGMHLNHDFYVVVGKQCRTENA